MGGVGFKVVRPRKLVAFIAVQLVAAGTIIPATLVAWASSQTAVYRMSIAVPLIVIPLEGAAAVLALPTFRKPRCQQVGAWLMIGLFRIVISLQLPWIPWRYVGPWPPPPGAIRVLILEPVEFILGLVSFLWVYSLRDVFAGFGIP